MAFHKKAMLSRSIPGTRYVFTALHRDEAHCEKNKASGWLQGPEIALDQLVAHAQALR